MKKISFLLTVVFILNFIIVGNVFAANLCKIGAYFNPSNPYQGTEFTIKISTSEITNGIKGVNLILDYDAGVFDFARTEKADGWTISRIDSQYTFFTDNHEPTMNAGNIGTIILRVKDNAKEGGTSVKVSSIEVVKEDNSILKIGELDQNITIRKNETKTSENKNESNNEGNANNTSNAGNSNTTGNINNNTNITENTNNAENTSVIENTDTTGNTNTNTNTNTDNTKNTILDINTTNKADTNSSSKNTTNQTNTNANTNTNTNTQKNNSTNKTTNNQIKNNTTTKKKLEKDLPYAGDSIWTDCILLLSIACFIVIAYKSFIKYKNM